MLGYTSSNTVINWVPPFTFGVHFGLSMDHHVFAIFASLHTVEMEQPGLSLAVARSADS